MGPVEPCDNPANRSVKGESRKLVAVQLLGTKPSGDRPQTKRTLSSQNCGGAAGLGRRVPAGGGGADCAARTARATRAAAARGATAAVPRVRNTLPALVLARHLRLRRVRRVQVRPGRTRRAAAGGTGLTARVCRRPDGAHALLTRTEAKSEFLLKDCDLDARPPPLRALVRRNPHAARGAAADMRLYVRACVEARAREVWGGEAELLAERARRDDKRERVAQRAQHRRLRALRMDVRSSLFRRGAEAHLHRWGPERRAADDEYSRDCLDCGHTETYEKM